MNAHTIGSKYAETEHLDIAEIAKLVRKDLKAAHPDVKASVRISRFSMGQSLDVAITAWSGEVHSRDRIREEILSPYGTHRTAWMSDDAIALQNSIEAIVAAYNYDNSDLVSDYHHVRFYTHVSFACSDRERVEAAVRAEMATEMAEPDRIDAWRAESEATPANDGTEWSVIAAGL